jgi:excisionase family DNA binding protein
MRVIEDVVVNDECLLRPIAMRVQEACRLTGIGRSKLYELIAAGEIEIVKVGTIALIPIASLTDFLKRRVHVDGRRPRQLA